MEYEANSLGLNVKFIEPINIKLNTIDHFALLRVKGHPVGHRGRMDMSLTILINPGHLTFLCGMCLQHFQHCSQLTCTDIF